MARPKEYTRDILIEKLQEFATELGRTPTSKELNKSGYPSYGTYTYEFGSWDAALDAANLERSTAGLDARTLSSDFLISELHRFVKERGKVPSTNDLIKSGYPSRIAYERAFGSWRNAIKHAGLKIRNSSPGRKYTCNQDFFKTWSHDMAYILGYWFADGCICKVRGRFVFSISSNDEEHLLKINKILDSDRPLDLSKKCRKLIFESEIIYSDIVCLGGTPRKSRTARMPYIPDKYKLDFIRGYFDGDGCVSLNKRRYGYPTLGFCGTKHMLEGIIETLGPSNTFIYKAPELKNNNYDIHYYGERAIAALDRLYNNANLFLQRKYETYLEGKKWKRKRALVEQSYINKYEAGHGYY